MLGATGDLTEVGEKVNFLNKFISLVDLMSFLVGYLPFGSAKQPINIHLMADFLRVLG
jgi:hypothetical protein